jgi:hypothetical protein
MQILCSQLLGSIERYIGREVTVLSHVIVGGHTAFVACDYDAYVRGERLAIDDGGTIERALLKALPAYGGGQCTYDEEATIVGTVRCSKDEVVHLVLKSCGLRRDGFDEIVIHSDSTTA